MPAPTPRTAPAPAHLAAAIDVYSRTQAQLVAAAEALRQARLPYQPELERLDAASQEIALKRGEACDRMTRATEAEGQEVLRLERELDSAHETVERAAKAARAASEDATAFEAGGWLAKTQAKPSGAVVEDEAAAQTDIASRWPMFLDELFPRKLARSALRRLWPTLRDREHEGHVGIDGVTEAPPDWTVTLERVAELVEEEAEEASA